MTNLPSVLLILTLVPILIYSMFAGFLLLLLLAAAAAVLGRYNFFFCFVFGVCYISQKLHFNRTKCNVKNNKRMWIYWLLTAAQCYLTLISHQYRWMERFEIGQKRENFYPTKFLIRVVLLAMRFFLAVCCGNIQFAFWWLKFTLASYFARSAFQFARGHLFLSHSCNRFILPVNFWICFFLSFVGRCFFFKCYCHAHHMDYVNWFEKILL